MYEGSLKERIDNLKAAARGYMMMAMAMKEAGYEERCKAYLKSELDCWNKAEELEAQLESERVYLMVA